MWAGCLVAMVATVMAGADASGWWQGTLPKEAGGLRLALRLTRADDGTWSATLDSPDQGQTGVPLDDVAVTETTVRFALRAMATRYEGTLSPDGATLAGTLTARDTPLPLNFARAGGGFAAERPQDPRPPFPYEQREALIDNPAAPGVRLAGTLTVPPGDGPWPAVLLLAGSGPNDRDEKVFGHRPFAVLADHLTRRGIAVLRCDKRGIGGSAGDFANATTQDFAADGTACLRWLREQPRIAADRVGLLGHSEGALVAPLIAAARPELPTFVVLLGAPGVDGAALLTRQAVTMARLAGADEAALAALEPAHRAVVTRVAQGAGTDELTPLVAALVKAQGGADDAKLHRQIAESLLSPWMVGFIKLDPAPALRGIKAPVLVMTGELDVQVDAAQNMPPIVAALEAGGVRDYTVCKVARANHLFQPANTGGVDEYARIAVTMMPAVLDRIGDWIVSRTAR